METHKEQFRQPNPQNPYTCQHKHITHDDNIFCPPLNCSMDQNSKKLEEHLQKILKLNPDALHKEIKSDIWNNTHSGLLNY
jgi:hypothetical protein